MNEEAIIKELKELNKKLELAKMNSSLKEQIFLKERINFLEKKSKFYEMKNIEMESDQGDQYKRR